MPDTLPTKTCSVEGCERPYDARGYCKMHYKRFRKHGTSDGGQFTPAHNRPVHERFLENIDLNGPTQPDGSQCHLWTGGTTTRGYGFLKIGRKTKAAAHRRAFEYAHHRKIKEGLFILHTCDNPPCVNPAHLWEGTNQQNIVDKCQKGRQGFKLNVDSVRDIRHRYATERASQQTLAIDYGVDVKTISNVVNMRSWTHVTYYKPYPYTGVRAPRTTDPQPQQEV